MIFFRHETIDETHVKFSAIEENESKGECTLDLSGKYADVCLLDCADSIIIEGLLKSAYNYAASKNFYMATCSCKNVEDILKRMNFSFADGRYVSDIPTVLMGSCCKHN